ncbi:hypothetical protein Vadar_003463 [Vaccinium darrowii]|uniref:Uncharacterized protein n=1 Tax=Vaccinium darrowii TaxID=229202 RepID=A0ACB7ZH65_9ERIC|nr:hypothetical protein Vadar_003463 [Vaccinium darrowii]
MSFLFSSLGCLGTKEWRSAGFSEGEVRNQVLALKTELTNEINTYIASLDDVNKYAEAQKEIVRKQDMEYQRQIAEEVDYYFLKWDQLFRTKGKALLEEKARLEAEKKRAEEAKAAAVEADRKAAKEAAEKVAKEDSARAAAAAFVASKAVNDEPMEFSYYGVEEALQAGHLLKCEESAIKLEERRQQIYQEVAITNEKLRLGLSNECSCLDLLLIIASHAQKHESKIKMLTKTIAGRRIITKVDGLLGTFFDSSCPQSITVAIFAEKIVEQQDRSKQKAIFAHALVIVKVSAEVPLALDLVLCQLNRACIYMTPKYITYSKSVFGTKQAYLKAIGYKEAKGEIESEESYVSRVKSCMKLYGALVQTKVEGVENKHDLTDGWAWLGSFLKFLPANLYTANALLAFLDMAGFALYEQYKKDFISALEIIYRDFVVALKEQGQDAKLTSVITGIQTFIESQKFLEEPEGRTLQSRLLSRHFSPEHSKPSWSSLENRRVDSGILMY